MSADGKIVATRDLIIALGTTEDEVRALLRNDAPTADVREVQVRQRNIIAELRRRARVQVRPTP